MIDRGLNELPATCRLLLCDLDGTLTHMGRLTGEVVAALHELARAGFELVLVTGRPAGWAQALYELLPFRVAVAENGGVVFDRDAALRKILMLPAAELTSVRAAMREAGDAVIVQFPQAAWSDDSAYREFDLAIDWNEHCRVAIEDADAIVQALRARGFAASRSSVHVNFGPVGVDKWTTCRFLLSTHWPTLAYDRCLYIGDSLNDAPMFAQLPSVGVGNIERVWHQLAHRPNWVTQALEGAGFCELARALLARR